MLPGPAQNKLTTIRLRAADAKALQASGSRSIAGLRQQEQHHMSTLARLKSGGQYDNTKRDIAEAEAALSAVQAEIASLLTMIGDRDRRLRNEVDTLQRLEAWAERTNSRKFRPVAPVKPDLGGATIVEALASVRGKISDAQADWNRIKAASLPAADLKAAVRAQVATLATPPTIRNRSGDVAVDWPGQIPGGELQYQRTGLGFLAWLAGDQIVARLEAEIDATTDEQRTVSAEAKAAADTEFPAIILAHERVEEALIEMATAAGLDVLRRPDASPLAVLGIELDKSATSREAA